MDNRGKILGRRRRLPNHFGSIKYLGPGRRNPYGVYPSKSGKAICYVPDWETGYQVLVLHRAGVYEPGMEKRLEEPGREALCMREEGSRDKMVEYAKRVMADIADIKAGKEVRRAESVRPEGHTFGQVYASFHEHKFGNHAKRKLSRDTRSAYNAAWQMLGPVAERTLDEVDVDTLETLVNGVADRGYSEASVSRVVTLIHQLYRYAHARGYCRSTAGLNVEMPATRCVVHHQDFTDSELAQIWRAYKAAPAELADTARMVLIMCYSGFRIGEFAGMETVLDEDIPYFRGGVKTAAGRNRIVPIHSAILPLVREIREGDQCVFLCGKGSTQFRRDMKKMLAEIGVDDPEGRHGDGEARYHTPHSTRHTFSRLCESYGVSEADRKRMMGHSLRGDVTNGTYGHRTIRELSEQLEKIMVPVME